MQDQSLFQFNEQELYQKNFILKSKAKSLACGRRVYFCNDGKNSFWLKAQLNGTHEFFQNGFIHEIEAYRSLNLNNLQNVSLPYRLIDFEKNTSVSQFGSQILLIAHAEALFLHSPDELSKDQIIHKMLQALNVLEKLHESHWIHGDLKHEHFVEFAKTARLIDFEQARRLTHIENNYLSATPRYMAPELFNGDRKSRASDIYALGIIFYEWLSQKRLSAENYHDWAVLHCQSTDFELPKQYSVFQSAINSMLNKAKDKRMCDFSALKLGLVAEIV